MCRAKRGHTCYIALYMDIVLFVAPSLDKLQRVNDRLKREYGIKDICKALQYGRPYNAYTQAGQPAAPPCL